MAAMPATRKSPPRRTHSSAAMVAAAGLLVITLLMVLSGLGPTSAAFAAEPTLGAADTFWATAWNTGLYRHVEATVAYV
ncbi:MAG: hypothetical protein V1912_03195, partial [bacterium]